MAIDDIFAELEVDENKPSAPPQQPGIDAIFDELSAPRNVDSITDLMVRTGDFGQSMGIVPPESQGTLTDSINAIKRGFTSLGSSFLNTLDKMGVESAGEARAGIMAMISANGRTYNRPQDFGFIPKAIEGTITSLPMIGAAALALTGVGAVAEGGVAAVAATTLGRVATTASAGALYGQSFGDNVDEVNRMSEGRLSPAQVYGWANLKSIISAGTESTFGLETRLGAGLNALMGKVAKKEAGYTLEQFGRYSLGKPWAGGWAGWPVAVGKESFENLTDPFLNTLADEIYSGKDLDAVAKGIEGVSEGMPATLLMTGSTVMMKTGREYSQNQKIMDGVGEQEGREEKQVEKIKALNMTPEDLNEEQLVVDAFKVGAERVIGKEQAAKLGGIIRDVSRNFAIESIANDQPKKSVDFIQSLNQSFVDMQPGDLSIVSQMFDEKKPSDEVLSFIIKKNHNFAETVDNIKELSNAIYREKENQFLTKHLESAYSEKRTESISESYRTELSKLFDGKQEARLTPNEVKAKIPASLLKSLMIQPLDGVTFYGKPYIAYAKGLSIVLKPQVKVSKGGSVVQLSQKETAKSVGQIESDIRTQADQEAAALSGQLQIPPTKETQIEENIQSKINEVNKTEIRPEQELSSRKRYLDAMKNNFRLRGALFDINNVEQRLNDYEITEEPKVEPTPVVTQTEVKETKLLPEITRPASTDIYAQQNANSLRGLYIPEHLLAIYFKGADAGTIFEEWFHHVTVNKLMPSTLERSLANTYGTDDEKRDGLLQTSATHEKVAKGFLQYIKNGKFEGDSLASFQWMSDVLGQNYKEIGQVSEEARPIFDKLSQEAKFQDDADAVQSSLEDNPPTTKSLKEDIAEVEKELESIPSDMLAQTASEQAGLTKGQISSKAYAAAGSKLKQISHTLFPELGVIKSIDDLGNDSNGNYSLIKHVERVHKLKLTLRGMRAGVIKKANWKNSQTVKEANELADEYVKELEGVSDDSSSPFYKGYEATGGPKVYEIIKSIMGRTFNAGTRWLSFIDTGFLRFGLNKKDSALAKLSTELYQADALGMRMDNEYQAEASKSYGEFNRYDDVELDGRTYPVQQALALYIHSNATKLNYTSDAQAIKLLYEKINDGTAKRWDRNVLYMLTSNNVKEIVTVKAINDAIDYVNANKKQFSEIVKFTQASMFKNHGIGKAIAKDLMDIEVGTLEGLYAPFVTLREGVTEDQVLSAISAEGVEYQNKPGVGPLFTQQVRRAITGSPLNLNYLDLVEQYMKRTNHFISHANVVKKSLVMMNRKDVSDMVYRKFGDSLNWSRLQQQIFGALKASGRVEAYTAGESSLARFRTNVTMASLGGKPWISAQQHIAMVTSLGDIEIKSGVSNYYNAWKYVTRQRLNNIKKLGIIENPLEGYAPFELAKTKSSVIGALSTDQEQYEAAQHPDNSVDKFIRKIGIAKNRAELAYRGYRRIDTVVKYAIWQTAYDTEFKRIKMDNPMFTNERVDKQATQAADKVAMEHVPVNMSSRRSYFQGASEWKRMWWPFSTQLITYFNKYMSEFTIPFISAYKLAGGTEAQRLKAGLNTLATRDKMRKAFWYVALPSLLISMIQRRRLPDEEELFRDMLLYPVATLGPLGSALQNYSTYGNQIRINPIVMVGEVQRGAEGMINLYKGVFGESPKPIFDSLLDVAALPSDLAGIPKYFTITLPRALKEAVDEETAEESAITLAKYMFMGGEAVK